LQREGLRVEQVHVHLRTNVAEASVYGRALGEVATICRAAGFRPRFVDCGGGFPPPHTRTKSGRAYDRRFCRNFLEIDDEGLKSSVPLETGSPADDIF
jgi:diaminopimelate decarboxylase